MRKYFILIFLVSVFVLNAVPIPDFDAFHRSLYPQTVRWKGTNSSSEPSREYQVGDTNTFWRWDLSVMPPAWIQTPATCRAVGEHCYVFVADDQWNLNMDQDDVDIVLNYLENETMNSSDYGAIEMDIDLFGPIPDEIDNDPRLIVFYSELGSFGGSTFDGYFSVYNQVTEQQAQQMNPSGHSNECEMIYMTCSPLNPTDPIRISVLSHELEHLIHWGQDVNEETWLDEGCAELAMVYFGMPDPITGFPSQPDNQLNVWNQEWADYVKVMLFFTYLREQFTTDQNELILDIVSDPTNGLNSIVNQLIDNGFTIPFESVFTNWTIANFVDDTTIDQGQYGYELLDLPNFSTAGSHTSFPVNSSGTVDPWAADYIRVFPNGMNIEHEITVNNADQAIGLIRKLNDVEEFEVETFNVNASWTGYLPPEWDDLYYYAVYVYANHNATQLDYSYSLEEVVANDDELIIPENEISIYPNPFNPSTTISFNVPQTSSFATIEIYNLKGQKVKTFSFPNGSLGTSKGLVVWNGTDDNNKPVSSGIYFARLKAGNVEASCKMLLLK
ncbi:MAG: T9SS type A sorting domain-containing protein [Candidatus Cloacimonetes bacterium]|nr:T9SS type A sorting domain-containing protein [Candidatus Cloacimonadota bacterium]MCF7814216.1 T9SS type A sorting domain-containing protein [Candidatus Cloacimonadota bacterium]MCF7868125.1 T9SS type A sorting domain-containing protein [Candidatus Cloacimonadota bacterium]MCF7883591.1 T9SS type A sorting domain-containing protein [Candidatus Cloacimonadota bacterium]